MRLARPADLSGLFVADMLARVKPALRAACLLQLPFCLVAGAQPETSALRRDEAFDRQRPRLLLAPADLPRLRLRCGTAAPEAGKGPDERLGIHAERYRELRNWAQRNSDLPTEDGALYVPAFLHLMQDDPNRPDEFSQIVERALIRRAFVVDFDDAVAALDWCWEALPPEVRHNTAARLLEGLQPLRAEDSPLEHFIFHPKLCHLAAAIVLRGEFAHGSPEAQRIELVIAAATRYFRDTLPPFIRTTHGLAPVPCLTGDFEADLLFALELWDRFNNGTVWPEYAEILRGACDGYYWNDTSWRNFNGAPVHDQGSRSPTRPGEGRSALAAAAPLVLAHRTGSALAAWYASIDAGDAGTEDVRRLNRRWLRILHESAPQERRDLPDPPLARNLHDGWVLMRSAWRPGATVIAFDAGQPLLHNRQHADAGQFQITRRGRLALDSGDDVLLEAVAPRGGRQGVGEKGGDFEQFSAATVAHNCLLLFDPRDRLRVLSERRPALGGQRVVPGDWKPGDPADTARRQTGRLLAFETHEHFSYAAADLAKAYETKALLLYDRHLIFIGGRFLLVLDRVLTERADVAPTWLLQLPSRPLVGGEPLDLQFRRVGADDRAGIWQYTQFDDWLVADGGEGRLFVRTLLPLHRRWSVVGGPQTVLSVRSGPCFGRSYVGSGPGGYEYRITPASIEGGGGNAWYELGAPTDLGPMFGAGAGWGRLEVEPLEEGTEHTFLHVLVPTDLGVRTPPQFDVTATADAIDVETTFDSLTYHVTLTPRGASPGRVVVRDRTQTLCDRQLTKEVQPDAPLTLPRPF